MNEYDFYEIESQKPRRSRLRLALYLTIVMLLIVGLSWSAISGVVWFWEQAQEERSRVGGELVKYMIGSETSYQSGDRNVSR